MQLLRVRLCAGGAAADRPRAGAPHSHGALAGGRSAPPGVRRGRGASGHSASAQMDRHVVRRAHGDWGADARERALLDGSAPVAASISSASCAGTHSWLSSGSAASLVALKSTSSRCPIPTPLHQPAIHYLSECSMRSADLRNDVDQLLWSRTAVWRLLEALGPQGYCWPVQTGARLPRTV